MQSPGTNPTLEALSGPVATVADDDVLELSKRMSEESVGRIAPGEIWRKALHMTPGLLPFGLVLLEHRDPIDPVSLFVVTLICGLLTWVYIKSARIVRRDGEDDFVMTAVSYPALVVLTLVVFPAHAEFACVVAVILAFGDGSAYLAGKLLGRRKLPWNPHKTWVGTCSFVIVSAPIAAAAYWLEARPAVSFEVAAVCALTAAVCASAAESLQMRVTDNLRVGLGALVGVASAYYIIVGNFLPLS